MGWEEARRKKCGTAKAAGSSGTPFEDDVSMRGILKAGGYLPAIVTKAARQLQVIVGYRPRQALLELPAQCIRFSGCEIRAEESGRSPDDGTAAWHTAHFFAGIRRMRAEKTRWMRCAGFATCCAFAVLLPDGKNMRKKLIVYD